MTRIALLFTALLAVNYGSNAQNSVAAQRAATLGSGVNLSHLDNYWNGTPAQHYGDHVKFAEVNKRQLMLADIARNGLKTVRIPICFSAWASLDAPYRWDFPQNLAAADSLVSWALQQNLRVIIDFHHPEMSGAFPQALNPNRIKWLWTQIATRYRNTDPNRVFLELWNEPHGVKLTDWIATATGLIQTIRPIAPNHTLIVGAHDWNGIDALTQLPLFEDKNIIYTFHSYDPFVFTHQGASWVTELKDARGVAFPASSTAPAVPASARGTWVENALKNYPKEGNQETMTRQLAKAKAWSEANNVPIFCGEFGSYSEFADSQSRCNHVFAMYQALGMMDIPITFWEWDGGFNYFQKGSTTLLSNCAKEALGFYVLRKQALGVENNSDVAVRIWPNPARDSFQVEADQQIELVEIVNLSGQSLLRKKPTNNQVSIAELADGFYVVKVFGINSKLLNYKKLVKW